MSPAPLLCTLVQCLPASRPRLAQRGPRNTHNALALMPVRERQAGCPSLHGWPHRVHAWQGCSGQSIACQSSSKLSSCSASNVLALALSSLCHKDRGHARWCIRRIGHGTSPTKSAVPRIMVDGHARVSRGGTAVSRCLQFGRACLSMPSATCLWVSTRRIAFPSAACLIAPAQ